MGQVCGKIMKEELKLWWAQSKFRTKSLHLIIFLQLEGCLLMSKLYVFWKDLYILFYNHDRSNLQIMLSWAYFLLYLMSCLIFGYKYFLSWKFVTLSGHFQWYFLLLWNELLKYMNYLILWWKANFMNFHLCKFIFFHPLIVVKHG